MNLRNKTVVFCLDCGSCLGIYRPFYAKEHLKQYPLHRRFLTKTIVDPLTSKNPDEWVAKLKTAQQFQTPILNKKNFGDETPTSEQKLMDDTVQS